MPERGDARVRVCQDKDGFRFGMAAQGRDNQLGLSAACGCLYRTLGDLKKVEVIWHSSTIFEWR